MPDAAVLYPGEMGCAVARLLVGAGWRVVTHLWGPSLVCRADAEAAGVVDLASLDDAVAASDVVIALVPPSAALSTAEVAAAAARRRTRRPLYLDGNSVSPGTMAAVATACESSGLDCVDGSFIGSAADLGGRTRLYLSGPRADELAALLPAALHVRAAGPEVGSASALKLAFAGFNKGLVALFLAVVDAGIVAGEPDELLDCLRAFYPGTIETLERLLPTYPRHVARRAEELDELAGWLTRNGSDAGWATAARDVLERLAALGLEARPGWTFADVLEAWTSRRPPSGAPS